MASLPDLPTDVIENIFERLPTKEITQSKSLSKEWYAKISSTPIIRRHLALSSAQNRVTTLLQLEHIFLPLQYMETIDVQQMKGRGVFEGMRDFEYVASCESVILVAYINDKIFLVNPTITSHFELPNTPICFPSNTKTTSVLFGVGYHPEEGDYQILRLSLFHCMEWKSELKINSKRYNRWKYFGEFPYPCLVNTSVVYANNCVHWLLFSEHIVTFDLVRESFRLINLPTQVNRNYRHHSFTTINNDTLVLIPTFYMANETLEIWLLTIYNDDTSWERHFVDLHIPVREVYRVINFQPLYFLEQKRNKIVLRINPLGTFWCWDLNAHLIQPYAGELVEYLAASTFPIVKSLS